MQWLTDWIDDLARGSKKARAILYGLIILGAIGAMLSL